MRRVSSLSNLAGVAIDRETDSKYDNIKQVAEQLDDISALVVVDSSDNIVINPDISTVAGMSIDVASLTSANTVLNDLNATANTLDYGDDATASYNRSTGVITLGIPEGEKGDNGLTPDLSIDYDSTSDELSYTVGVGSITTTTTLGINIKGEIGSAVEAATANVESTAVTTASDAVDTYLDSNTTSGAYDVIISHINNNVDDFKGVQGDTGLAGLDGLDGSDGKTPIYEFIYNEDTGDVDYRLIEEVPYDDVQEWD